MRCESCEGRGYVGLASLPMRCPDCGEEDILTEIERQVGSPSGFARLCAFIGYTDAQCVTALVSETELSADEARAVVEEEYSRFAREQADETAAEFERQSTDGGSAAGR